MSNWNAATSSSSHVPVLSVLPLALFAAPSHLGLVACLPGRSHLDWGVLQCSRLQGHPVATLLKTDYWHKHPFTRHISVSDTELREKSQTILSSTFGCTGDHQNKYVYRKIISYSNYSRTLSRSSTTSVWTSPWTDSPFTWVMRSPALNPASCAGLPSSTHCGHKQTHTHTLDQNYWSSNNLISCYQDWQCLSCAIIITNVFSNKKHTHLSSDTFMQLFTAV